MTAVDEQIDAALFARLMVLPIGPEGAQLPFTARLARENGWSIDHARQVVIEYRRFLYLAATATPTLPVTPSEAVDQAWHLHLAYTRDYWGGLCETVLGRPLHHGPTSGGVEEGDRFRTQYENTLARYTVLFGMPPSGIWPDGALRFSARMRWVDVDRYLLLPRAPALIGIAVASVALLTACSALRGVVPPEDRKEAVFFLFGGLLLLCIALQNWFHARRKSRRKKDDGGCGGCSSASGQDCGSDGGSGCGSGCGGGGD